MGERANEAAGQAGDRRPIAARRLGAIQHSATWLAQRRVSPNAISIAGMIAAVGAGAALALSDGHSGVGRGLLIVAAGLVQVRLLANVLDGLVAVEGGMRSAVGELYNEIPDRVSDTAVLIGAGYAVGSIPLLGYLAAILAMFVTYIRALGRGCGLASDFSGPMAKQQRMFLITVASLYFAAAPESWRPTLPPIAGIEGIGVMGVTLAVISFGCILTAGVRMTRLAAALEERGL